MADTTQAHDDGNGRIRAARERAQWETRIEAGQEEIKRMLADFCAASIADRKDIHARVEKIEDDQQTHEIEITKLKANQGILAGLNGAFTTIGLVLTNVFHR